MARGIEAFVSYRWDFGVKKGTQTLEIAISQTFIINPGYMAGSTMHAGRGAAPLILSGGADASRRLCHSRWRLKNEDFLELCAA